MRLTANDSCANRTLSTSRLLTFGSQPTNKPDKGALIPVTTAVDVVDISRMSFDDRVKLVLDGFTKELEQGNYAISRAAGHIKSDHDPRSERGWINHHASGTLQFTNISIPAEPRPIPFPPLDLSIKQTHMTGESDKNDCFELGLNVRPSDKYDERLHLFNIQYKGTWPRLEQPRTLGGWGWRTADTSTSKIQLAPNMEPIECSATSNPELHQKVKQLMLALMNQPKTREALSHFWTPPKV